MSANELPSGLVASITFLSGPLAGATVPITRTVTTIGRDETNDIVVKGDQQISRRHARLVWVNGIWVVENISGHNWIVVNQQQVQQSPVQNQALISLGKGATFVFNLRAMEPVLPPQQPQPVFPPPLQPALAQNGTIYPSPGLHRWLVRIFIGLGIMLLLEICSVRFHWTWTGFQDNTLWDWLKLLLLPVVLSAAPLWANTRQKWGTTWTIAFAVVLIALAVLIIGGYMFGWTWTGFQDNTLWDWLELLVLPLMLALVTAQLRSSQDQARTAELQKRLAEQIRQHMTEQQSNW